MTMAQKAGLTKAGVSEDDIREMMPRLEEIAFDSERKLMSTKYRLHGVSTILTKGAVDVLLDRSVKLAESGGSREINDKIKEEILRQNQEFSENGLRVLAFAYKEVDEGEELTLDEENGFTFIGLVAMIDPPREEAAEAVRTAKLAGIRPVMITGDHKVTAAAIAAQIGIFEEGDLAVTGQELDAMSDEKLDELLEEISVYARVSPENKIRIVKSWQKKGRITAMTGDGVNDAPALKKADIGVAMGITGTEVSKDASAMILADDNFATIIKAVLNGRNVYRNIKNAIQFLLSGNMSAIIAVLACSVLALPSPFEPVHLLFINLLTDSLPALAIGMEPSDPQLLTQKPRDPKEGILTGKFVRRLLGYGALIAAATMTAFSMGLQKDAATAATMAFAQFQHVDQTDQRTDHTPGRTHSSQSIPKTDHFIVSTFNTAQFGIQDAGNQFLIGTIDNQHDSFFQKIIIDICRRFLQLKQPLFSSHIRQINNRMYNFTFLCRRSF